MENIVSEMKRSVYSSSYDLK